MKNESEVCTILRNSFKEKDEEAFKIPDPSSMYSQTIARPFDLIASWRDRMIFIEAKYMKTPGSFNLQRIEEHQIEALQSWKISVPSSESWIVLGVTFGRADHRLYIFKDIHNIAERRTNKQNFLRKELEKLPYYKVRKNLIDLEESTN